MKVTACLFLLFICGCASVNAQSYEDSNDIEPRQTRARPIKLCGAKLGEALMLVCSMRGKRHAVPEPSYQLSPFLMSIYRPSIDDSDNWRADWADMKLESAPGRDVYDRIGAMRVSSIQVQKSSS